MTPWTQRSGEERGLLNPAFCSTLIWHAIVGYGNSNLMTLSFEEAFLILPFVLHRETREKLPRSTRTSLAVWLNENPLTRGKVGSRARLLVPFTKEALTFGGLHGFFRIDAGLLRADVGWKKPVNQMLKTSSDEVRTCAKRAEFVGKWFSESGSMTTVLALIGVRP